DRPWIVSPIYEKLPPASIAVGFTDEWFELKYGIYFLLYKRFCKRADYRVVSISDSPRWRTEADHGGMSWEAAAGWLGKAKVFVGCNSALHVLACAVGTPKVVILEPAEARHNDVFWPYGKKGPRVYGNFGGDGQLSFDARHLVDLVETLL
ncbi:MAG: hypothetical protein KGL39_57005, partial [Patescibacteria group bacterium]|nr:hypothetical protein [Patescibacteria group bacterium]